MEATTLGMMKRRFAGREAFVEREFTESESFRALCRDYLACITVLARWQDTESEEARLRSGEYTELLTELTNEIESRLEASSRERPGA